MARLTRERVYCLCQAYGAQAVVVSIDPRRVYVADPSATQRPTVRTQRPGPNGERFCWWQCTVKVLFLSTAVALCF